MELSATGKVILGMLAAKPRSGYEIKQLVDNSARFFWAASYGQIYPELKKLEKEGLITGDDSSRGGRQRTTFKLTAAGKREAREWIAGPPQVFELRDEGLLELFFAGSIDPERAAGDRARARRQGDGLRSRAALAWRRRSRATGQLDGPEHEPGFRLADRAPLRNRDERMGGGVVRARRRAT